MLPWMLVLTAQVDLVALNFLVRWKAEIAFYNSVEEVGDEIDQIQGQKFDFNELSSFSGTFVGLQCVLA